MPVFTSIVLLLLVEFHSLPVFAERLQVGDFSADDVTGWEAKVFSDETQYTLEKQGLISVLKAVSKGTASGMIKEVQVDLKKTPYMNWRWRTDSRLDGLDERQKSGDDYVARVYVVVSGGLFFWRTLALNYVWSSNQEKGASWPNAYAGENAMMLALRSGKDARATWVTEKRNVYEDLQRYFGKEIQTIGAIAVMTDTDNSEGQAVTYYGDIYFTGE